MGAEGCVGGMMRHGLIPKRAEGTRERSARAGFGRFVFPYTAADDT
jgi:hypothetical protein